MSNLYNLPIFKQLVELLQWVLIHLDNVFASWGLGPNWTWGLAIIGLTVIVRLILFPLTWKQFSSAQAMQAIQPKIKELQQKYKKDRAKLQQETMKLYQEHHVNPFASCLPLVLQLPVFFALYVAIAGRADYLNKAAVVALQNASFLWIPHLGNPDPTYVLLVLYVVTQLVSTELMLTPQTDTQQKYLMRAMPVIFVIFLFRFPAGLFVYWVTTNLWTIGQQLIIRRVMKSRELAPATAQLPRKRSRFMDALMSAQQSRNPEDDILEKRRQKAAELAAARESEATKSGSSRATKDGRRRTAKQDGRRRTATQDGGPRATKQDGDQRAKQDGGQRAKQGGGQTAKQSGGGPAAKRGGAQSKKGVRRPPPGKGKHKSRPPGGQGTSKSGPAGG